MSRAFGHILPSRIDDKMRELLRDPWFMQHESVSGCEDIFV
jgi:hypothetical protein